MKNFKLESFTNLLGKNHVLADALNKAKKKIKSGEDIKKITNNEIMPIIREKNLEITANEITSYLKFGMNKLTRENMEKISGGINAGRLTFGIINGAIGLASVMNSSINKVGSDKDGATPCDKNITTNEELSNKLEKSTEDETKISLSALLGESEKALPNTPNDKKAEYKNDSAKNLSQGEKSFEETDVMQNSTYKVTKIEGLEGERAVIVGDLIDSSKISKLPEIPPNVGGDWTYAEKTTYEGTVFVVPNNVNCYFNPNFWDQIKTKGDKSILVYKNSNAQHLVQKETAKIF